MTIKKYLPFLAAAAFCLIQTPVLRAQIAIHADVNKTIVSLNEQITLTVSVTGSGGSLPDPQIPILTNFSVYSSGKSQSISIMNGHMETDAEYTYVLVPRFVGKGQIPPISVSYKGRRYQTRPMVIEVSKNGAPGSQARTGIGIQPSASGYNYARSNATRSGKGDVFVTADLSKKKVYVNEQTTLSVKFFTAVGLAGSPQYTPPKLSGFLSEDMPPQRNGQAVVGGRTYFYSEIKLALFPVQAGRLPIGQASVNCRLQKNIAVDPFSQSFLNNFFSGQLGASEPKTLRSDPLILTALPLPSQGRPPHFSGAVGQFKIAAAIDRNHVNVGDAVNLTVTISGKGNLKGIDAPPTPAIPDFHVYDTVSTIDLNKLNDIVQGQKTFKTVLVPRISGTLTIPKISFSYFDPESKAYRGISTPALTITATKGPAGSSTSSYNPSATAPESVSTISEDVRYLKPYQKTPLPERLLTDLSWAGPINALPFALFAVFLGLDLYERALAKNPREIRKRQAFKKAAIAIRKTQKGNYPESRQVAVLLSESLIGYLADKLGQSPASLTVKNVEEGLPKMSPKISKNTIENMKLMWNDLDLKRFAPASAPSLSETSQMAQDVLALIESIERELRS